MAQIEILIPLIFKWEGGYGNDPIDSGGPTKMGVTLKTWQAQGYDKTGDGIIDTNDLKLLTKEDVIEHVLRPHYWKRWSADEIRSQAIANILVDWVWTSGKYGITIPQGILGVKQDGIVGNITLNAVNCYPDQESLFNQIKQARKAYFNMICLNRPANKRFLKGWLNRLDDFKWFPVVFCFFLLFSCKSPEKTTFLNRNETEITDTHIAVSDKKDREVIQQENLRLNVDEKMFIENVVIVFDSLNNSLKINQISVNNITKERIVNAEKQKEHLVSQTEKTAKETVVSTNIHKKDESEIKQKTSCQWRVAGWLSGVIFVIIFSALWRKIVKKT